MDYKRFDDTIFARIDRGEDIVEMLKEIALKEDVKLASVDGLGAIGRLETGLFDTTEKKYYNTCERDGAFEITSLTGTVTTMNGEYYGHLHLSQSDFHRKSSSTFFLTNQIGYSINGITYQVNRL